MRRSDILSLALVLSTLTLVSTAQAQAPAPPATTSAPATEIAKSANPELVGMLTSQLGITPKQAEGGAGAVFSYAKGKLKAEDYTKVAKAVPGIDGLIKAAPVLEKKPAGGAMGAVTGVASQVGGSAGAAAALAPSFQKLGVSGEAAGKFIPVVVGYVTKTGGASVGDLLGAVLK